MADIKKSALELIGNTPLLEPENYERKYDLTARLFLKLESFNPAGSIKDRAALFMIEDAEEKGILKPGATIIEPTSGNTGIGLASISAMKGYQVILTMPETMSVERRMLLAAYGAKIVLTEGAKGMAGAIEKAEELKKEIPGSVILGQFVNPANAKAHRMTTGPEIWKALEGRVDRSRNQNFVPEKRNCPFAGNQRTAPFDSGNGAVQRVKKGGGIHRNRSSHFYNSGA